MSQSQDQVNYAESTKRNQELALKAESEAASVVPAAPMKITFEFTGDCNLHCFFCDCEFARNVFRDKGHHKFSMDEIYLFCQINSLSKEIFIK